MSKHAISPELPNNAANIDWLNKQGFTRLYPAVLANNTSAVSKLLSQITDYDITADQADPRYSGDTILHLAVRNNNYDLVEMITKAFPESLIIPNSYNNVPLHIAANRGYKLLLPLLINRTVEIINLKGHEGRTPLHIAAYAGHVEIVKYLLGVKGIEIEAKDPEDYTPLHFAAYAGHIEIVRLLLKEGANAGAKALDNHTPLDYAIINGQAENVQILIKNNPEIIKSVGDASRLLNIILHDIIVQGSHQENEVGRLKVIEFLLIQGADPKICNLLDVIFYCSSIKPEINILPDNFEISYLLNVIKQAAGIDLETNELADFVEKISCTDPRVNNLLYIAKTISSIVHLNPINDISRNQSSDPFLGYQEFAFTLFKTLLIKKGMPDNIHSSYIAKIKEKYQGQIPRDLLQELEKFLSEDSESVKVDLANLEAQLLQGGGIQLVKGEGLNKLHTIGKQSSEFKFTGEYTTYTSSWELIKTLNDTEHFPGLSELLYRIHKYPACKAALEKLNNDILPKSLKSIISEIWRNCEDVRVNLTTQDSSSRERITESGNELKRSIEYLKKEHIQKDGNHEPYTREMFEELGESDNSASDIIGSNSHTTEVIDPEAFFRDFFDYTKF